MNGDPFDSVEVDEHAPDLPPWQEWVVPQDHPHRRFAVSRIPDGAPPNVREGFARRRIQAVTGECPCGGRIQWPTEDAGVGEIQPVIAPHYADCPAHDAVLIPAIQAFLKSLGRDG